MSKTHFSELRVIVSAFILVFLIFLFARPAMAAERFITNDNVHLRSGPGTENASLKLTKRGTEIQVDEYNPDSWSKVTLGDLQGYMKSEFITTQVQEEKSQEETAGSVSLTEWSEAKQIFTIGVPAQVYDVYSGITYFVKSFSNGLHADVEPITTEDTALLKTSYGGVWSWDPRPVWVTINGVTMAASINGMPHGGGVNPNNGMDGQVCIHFKGSSAHNGNSSFTRLHQEAAITAYNLAQ